MDALDECETESRRKLISHLLGYFAARTDVVYVRTSLVHTTPKMKFIITSRPYNDLERQFAAFTSINYAHFHGDDKADEICDEIDFVIDDLVRDVAHAFSHDDQQRLAMRLKQMNNRACLWLDLTFDITRQRPHKFGRPHDIDELLNMLPEQVADAYEKILCRTEDNDRTAAVLQLVRAATYCPLRLEEANIAWLLHFLSETKPGSHFHELHPSFKNDGGQKVRLRAL